MVEPYGGLFYCLDAARRRSCQEFLAAFHRSRARWSARFSRRSILALAGLRFYQAFHLAVIGLRLHMGLAIVLRLHTALAMVKGLALHRRMGG